MPLAGQIYRKWWVDRILGFHIHINTLEYILNIFWQIMCLWILIKLDQKNHSELSLVKGNMPTTKNVEKSAWKPKGGTIGLTLIMINKSNMLSQCFCAMNVVQCRKLLFYSKYLDPFVLGNKVFVNLDCNKWPRVTARSILEFWWWLWNLVSLCAITSR